MKKGLVCVLAFLFAVMLPVAGCGKDEPYGKVERDSALTGGNLSFVWDENTHTATFGKEGETIAFYPKDEAAGREKGNRIGFKIFAPCSINDFSKSKLDFQGTQYTNGSFMETVYDQQMNYFVLTPLVSEQTKKFTVVVKWTPESNEQNYIIKIADKVKFMAE